MLLQHSRRSPYLHSYTPPAHRCCTSSARAPNGSSPVGTWPKGRTVRGGLVCRARYSRRLSARSPVQRRLLVVGKRPAAAFVHDNRPGGAQQAECDAVGARSRLRGREPPSPSAMLVRAAHEHAKGSAPPPPWLQASKRPRAKGHGFERAIMPREQSSVMSSGASSEVAQAAGHRPCWARCGPAAHLAARRHSLWPPAGGVFDNGAGASSRKRSSSVGVRSPRRGQRNRRGRPRGGWRKRVIVTDRSGGVSGARLPRSHPRTPAPRDAWLRAQRRGLEHTPAGVKS